MKTNLKSLFLLIISMQLMACKAPTASDQSSIFDSYLQSEEPSQEVTISDGTSESILSSDEILTSEVDSLLVTFNVEIPIVLNPGDMIKIAGDFNGWDPFAQGYAFTMINEYNYELTLEFAQTQVGTTLLYKYVLVLADQVDTPWANVEGDARGGEITNRSYVLQTGAQTKNDRVLSFKNNIANSTVTSGHLSIITMNIEQFDDNRSRKIRIWTPAGYEDNLAHNYPVIYMHDGQNLFDAYTSFSGEWQVDETINQMINENFAGAIVVGIDNGGDKRLDELSPTWPLSSSVSQYNIKPEGEKYASFIVETLKPYIDQNFRTLSDRENTMIGGSSMGGVMSLYMTFAYPSTFGKSLIFSPSMWVYQNNSIETFIQTSNVSQLTNRPKVYVYAGGGELTITPFVPVIYDTLIENGYDDTLVKTHIQSGQGHNEAAWALHLPLALDWLLASI